jgi:hypothetical protein
VPQFNAILELLKVAYVFDKTTAARARLINRLHQDIKDKVPFIKDSDDKKIQRFANELLIVGYFNENPLFFPTYDGINSFDGYYRDETIVGNGNTFNLGTQIGRAQFRKIFEDMII